MTKPSTIKVFIDDMHINKTPLQKFLAGAFLFERDFNKGDMKGFEKLLEKRKIKNVEIIENRR